MTETILVGIIGILVTAIVTFGAWIMQNRFKEMREMVRETKETICKFLNEIKEQRKEDKDYMYKLSERQRKLENKVERCQGKHEIKFTEIIEDEN
ncbi:MAG: hypothetical protein FJZ11_05880 [Candidatus Omnitrophica bacterium]|nr:hypothetical protein [Candidatus Omnitrophota bacterium]